MAVTMEEIYAAADVITAQGEKPTLARVRKEVGGGSFTTISEAMQAWRADRAKADAPQPISMPETVTEAAEQATRSIWEAAIAMAESKLQTEREALAEARKEMEDAQTEAAQMADQMDSEIERLREQLAKTEKSGEEAILMGEGLRGELATEKEARKRSEDGLARTKNTVTELKQEITLVRKAEKKALEEAAELRVYVATAKEQIGSLKDTLKGVQGEFVDVTGRVSRFEGEIADRNKTIDTLKQNISTEKKVAEELKAKLAESDKALAVGNAETRGRIDSLERELLQKDTEIHRLDALLKHITTIPNTLETTKKKSSA